MHQLSLKTYKWGMVYDCRNLPWKMRENHVSYSWFQSMLTVWFSQRHKQQINQQSALESQINNYKHDFSKHCGWIINLAHVQSIFKDYFDNLLAILCVWVGWTLQTQNIIISRPAGQCYIKAKMLFHPLIWVSDPSNPPHGCNISVLNLTYVVGSEKLVSEWMTSMSVK